jgi:hypothetical protein
MANYDETAEEREQGRAVQAAIKETETVEIMDYVFDRDNPPDNDGDRSLEEPEDPLGIEEPDQEASADDGGEPEAQQAEGEEPEGEEPEQQYERDPAYVPSTRLREETDARRNAEREAAEWRARYDETQRLLRPQQPQQPPPPTPDMFADPEAWKQDFRQQVINETRQSMQRASIEEARARYGAEFDHAYQLLDSDPRLTREAQAVLASLNPGEAIMRLAEPYMGEFRQQRQEQELAQAQQIAARNGYTLVPGRGGPTSRPQQLRNNPPSLNGASGGGNTRRERLDPRGMDGSEEAIFREAFTNLR